MEVLLIGANRGLGYQVLKELLNQENLLQFPYRMNWVKQCGIVVEWLNQKNSWKMA